MHVENHADANMNRSGTPRRPSKKLIFAMSSSAGTCKRSISGSRTNGAMKNTPVPSHYTCWLEHIPIMGYHL